MKTTKILNEQCVAQFRRYLLEEEKSAVTVEKYLRDVRHFADFLGGQAVSHETTVAYKQKLIQTGYAVRSINSMLLQRRIVRR